MANARQGYNEATPLSNPSQASNSGAGGVCIMSSSWRDEQHPSFINFISCFLNDFIFNCGGLSVAFIFVANWDYINVESIFDRVQKLKEQFAYFYVVVTVPTKEQNDSFVHSYFRYGMEIGKPTFIPVHDLEMGFEKIVKIAHARGECKRQDAVSQLKAERERSVQDMDIFLKVVSSIPGVDNHDANALSQAIGSIEAIAKASKDYILENTDLSAEKAEKITTFFRDRSFISVPKSVDRKSGNTKGLNLIKLVESL